MIHEGQLEVFDLTLTAKAPFFIGSGKSYVKKEYVFLTPRFARVSCDEVMLLDETKFFHLLLERKLEDKYTQFMLGAQTDLYRFLTAECCLSLNDIRAVSRYSIAAADALDADHSLKEINAFVRGADGRVYVPGSSVKGALRTAILTDWILSDNSPHSAFGDTRKGFPEGTYLHTLKLKKDRNGAVLDDAVNSILRGLSISDSLPVSDTCMILAGKTDADPNGQTHRINLCRECIRPGTKLHFKLTLDQSVLHQKITAESLMNSVRTFDSFYEKTYLCHFTAPRHAAEVSYDNTLFLGGGVGFFSKTLTYPYLGEKDGLQAAINELSRSFRKHRHEEDRADGISPRTIKYALYEGELYPYGLCEVKLS